MMLLEQVRCGVVSKRPSEQRVCRYVIVCRSSTSSPQRRRHPLVINTIPDCRTVRPGRSQSIPVPPDRQSSDRRAGPRTVRRWRQTSRTWTEMAASGTSGRRLQTSLDLALVDIGSPRARAVVLAM